jgi:hypothetical protein
VFYIYAPFWLQVAYTAIVVLVKPNPWPTLPADISFAGFAFFVWCLTILVNANKAIAGGGTENCTKETRKQELPWCILLLFFSIAGLFTGYCTDGRVCVAWIMAIFIPVLSTRMLKPIKKLSRGY